MSTFYDVMRLINAVTASLVFCALVYKGTVYWEQYAPHQRTLYTSFTLYALGVAYGSVYSYNMHIPPGLQVFVFLAANIIALYAFVRYHNKMFSVK